MRAEPISRLSVLALAVILFSVATWIEGGVGGSGQSAAAAAAKTPCAAHYKTLRDQCYRKTGACGLNMDASVRNGKTVVTPVKTGPSCSSKSKDVTATFDGGKRTSDTSTSWTCGILGFEGVCGSGGGRPVDTARAPSGFAPSVQGSPTWRAAPSQPTSRANGISIPF